MATHREILYSRLPEGMLDAGCFRLVEVPRPADARFSPGDMFCRSTPTCAGRWAVGTVNTPSRCNLVV